MIDYIEYERLEAERIEQQKMKNDEIVASTYQAWKSTHSKESHDSDDAAVYAKISKTLSEFNN